MPRCHTIDRPMDERAARRLESRLITGQLFQIPKRCGVQQAGTFLVLWLGWLVTLVASFVAGQTSHLWWDKARLDLRMISCLLLVVAAWIASWALRHTQYRLAMLLVAVGMTLGFYGDSHVGDRFWWPAFPHPIVGGILFYGIGHLAYVAACWSIGRVASMSGGQRWWTPIAIWQIVALLAWAAVALTSDKEPGLRVPTLLYTLLVAATPGFATALAVQRRAFAWMALGGAMFLASDVLLAWQLFHGSFAGIDELTWINYGGGEMLIVYGAIGALLRPAAAPGIARGNPAC
jgi:hypothetical protein